jgi:organic radical activating enzyme
MSIIRINADSIARKSSYASLGTQQLLVYSKFVTIQGEGPFAGKRSLFLRLAGCNYGDKDPNKFCSWCDTKFFLANGKPESFDEIMTRVDDANTDLLVITGGEPLIQPNIVAFTKYALQYRPTLKIQFETNGSQHKTMLELLDLSIAFEDRIVVICSPKASGKSGYSKTAPVKLSAAVEFPNNFFYKFVVTADYSNVHHVVPEWAGEIPQQVYVSPMTVYARNVKETEIASAWDITLVDHEETRKNYKHAAHLAMQNNYTVSVQMHTWLDME